MSSVKSHTDLEQSKKLTEINISRVMKKIILLALTVLMVVGCKYRTDAQIEEAKRLNGFNIVVIDSCEYLEKSDARRYQGYGYFAHKGNCRFCKERRKQELKDLVEQIK